MLPVLLKILSSVVNLLSAFLLLVAVSGILIYRRKRGGFGLLAASVGVLWVCSTPMVSSSLTASLERRYLPVTVENSPQGDAIVVLGGAAGPAESPRVEIDLTSASDRIRHAALLYGAGKAPVVFAVGGGIQRIDLNVPEATVMGSLLKEWGVPPGAMVTEDESLNTRQNASNIRGLLESRGLRRILLVTSAMHMPRALSTFRKAGIDAIPSPTDYQELDRKGYALSDFLPVPSALTGTTNALRELLGIVYYRLRGWM